MLDFTFLRSLLLSSWGVFHPLVPSQHKISFPSYARLNASNRIFLKIIHWSNFLLCVSVTALAQFPCRLDERKIEIEIEIKTPSPKAIIDFLEVHRWRPFRALRSLRKTISAFEVVRP